MKATVEWIPVGERLPEPDIVVIICTDTGQVTVGSYFEKNTWLIAGELQENGVKFWADFPLPPNKLRPKPLDYRMLGWVD